MAKISVQMSYTIDYINKAISFGKIDARLDELDLDADIDEQLENCEEVLEKSSDKLALFLKGKVNKVFNKEKKPQKDE